MLFSMLQLKYIRNLTRGPSVPKTLFLRWKSPNRPADMEHKKTQPSHLREKRALASQQQTTQISLSRS